MLTILVIWLTFSRTGEQAFADGNRISALIPLIGKEMTDGWETLGTTAGNTKARVCTLETPLGVGKGLYVRNAPRIIPMEDFSKT